MGDSNTNQSTGNVEAVTALTNAATIRKLLRLPNEEGKTNFEILEVRSISDLANGHNCEVTIRVDLAFGHEGLPVPENERYSVRTETVRRIDLKEVAKLAGLEINDKQQYVGSVTDVESVGALLKAKLTEDDITIAQIKDVMWVRAKPESVGFVGMLTFAEGGESGEKLPTSITATLSAAEVEVGSKITGTVEVLPADAANKAFTAVTSDPTIATINVDGTEITGVKAGTVKITYTSVAAPSVKVEKTINVKMLPELVKPTGINVTGIPANPAVGDVINYEVEITPAGVSQEYNVVGDASAVTIDKVAKTITVLKAGSVNIYFGSVEAPEVQATVSIVAGPVRPTSILVYVDSPDFAVGDQVQYSVDVLPVESVDKTYTITSTNEAILKVNPNRTVTALAVGTAGIKLTSNANPSVESNVLEITVHPAVTSLTFTNPSEVQELSGEVNLGLTVDRTPSTATVGDVVYTVVETSSGVDAEITAGSTLTAIGVVVGSTIKVRATVSRWTVEGFNTVTADQVITITGSM